MQAQPALPLVVVAPVDVQIEEAELEKPTYWDDLNAELTLNAVQTKGNSDTFHLGMHGKVNLMRPTEDTDDWFNVFVFHQNRFVCVCLASVVC
mgnify:CR=1 FL=1